MSCEKPLRRFNTKIGRIEYFPCGRCTLCMETKAKLWASRINWEMRENYNYTGAFITLTYDDEHYNDINLNKEDLKKFLNYYKIYRNNAKLPKIKYYAVGEYGEHTGRKHYHIIAMGVNIDNQKEKEILSKIWDKGHIEAGYASPASIKYTLKYMYKEFSGRAPKKVIWGDITPPFSLMSKGIGAEHIKKHLHEVYNQKGEYIGAVINEGERYISVPWYWKNKFGYCEREPINITQTLNDKDKREWQESGLNYFDWYEKKMKLKILWKTQKGALYGKNLNYGVPDTIDEEHSKRFENQPTNKELANYATQNI